MTSNAQRTPSGITHTQKEDYRNGLDILLSKGVQLSVLEAFTASFEISSP
jgi:hypothetical protein